MTADDWARVRYFTREEFGPRADDLHPMLIYGLDQLREAIGAPIVIHGDPMDPDGRQPNSQHPAGRAVDCSCAALALGDFWLAAERNLSFTGIGLYPAWQRPGLHLDVRPDLPRARWWRDANKTYHALTARGLAILFARHAFMTQPPRKTA
jgi:hypothetical protein